MTAKFQTKKQLATEKLRHAIRSGRYEPGQPLKQNDIASDLGLSSTPVREALTELGVSGLVVYEQHRGNRVTTLDLDRIEQVYTARKILERETAKLALPNLDKAAVLELEQLGDEMKLHRKYERFEELAVTDEAFHKRIFEGSNNDYLLAAINNLWNSFPRYFMWNIDRRIDQSMQEHDAMIDALKTGDEDAFLNTVSDHLDHSLTSIRNHMKEQDVSKDTS